MNRLFTLGLLLVVSGAPAAVAEATNPVPLVPAAQELIYQGEATSILGREVRDPEARLVGRIIDVLVDDVGQPRAAIIDFGGFMGVGDRHIAVAWRTLHFAPSAGHGTITLEMTLDQIKATPEFRPPAKPAAPPVVVAVPPRTSTLPPAQADMPLTGVTPKQ